MTKQDEARAKFEAALKFVQPKERGYVEDYINQMIDIEGPIKMLALTDDAIRLDFALYLEIIANEGEKVFNAQRREISTDNLLNEVEMLSEEGQGHTYRPSQDAINSSRVVVDDLAAVWQNGLNRLHIDLAESYLESTAPSFVCDICHVRFPESKGYLSRPKGLGNADQASLHDLDCINTHHLIVEPEEKDRRA